MIESVIVNEWKAEAAAKTRIQDIVDILESKFGPVPDEAKAKIESTKSLDVLQRWVVLAAKANTLDDFRRAAGV